MVTRKDFAAEKRNPLEFLESPEVTRVVDEILNSYEPSGKILLILPCSARKPYGESRSQRLYWKAAREVVKEEDLLERATLSGVYGIVPASFESRVMDYDFNLNRSSFTRGRHREIVDLLSRRVCQFLLRFGKEFDLIISYGRERYRQVMELAVSRLKKSDHGDLKCAILPGRGKTLREAGLLELQQVLRDFQAGGFTGQNRQGAAERVWCWRDEAYQERKGERLLIIDRFEGEWAVVEYEGKTFNLPRFLLPKEAGEGSVVRISVMVDQEATKARKKTMERLADDLFEE